MPKKLCTARLLLEADISPRKLPLFSSLCMYPECHFRHFLVLPAHFTCTSDTHWSSHKDGYPQYGPTDVSVFSEGMGKTGYAA
jgi:hypothetical protein